MGDRISTQIGFADLVVGQRKSKSQFLDDVDRMIDWRPIEKILSRNYKKKTSLDGRPAYPALPLFKMLLLQRWYNLSDPVLEEAVNDRISFMRFTGFSLESSIPDETTICLFRNELGRKGIFEQLFNRINDQLESRQLLVRTGAIVDAGLISSCRRPRKVIDVIPVDRKEDDTEVRPDFKITYSDDEEAAWLKKGKHAYYGYKMHVGTDVSGFVLGGHVTPANKSDTGEFKDLLEELAIDPGAGVIADKGYASLENREHLHQRGYTEGAIKILCQSSLFSDLHTPEQKRPRFVNCPFIRIIFKVFDSFSGGWPVISMMSHQITATPSSILSLLRAHQGCRLLDISVIAPECR